MDKLFGDMTEEVTYYANDIFVSTILTELNPGGCSATIEYMYTGHTMQAHFTNLQVVSFHARIGNRVDGNFDDRLVDMLSKKLFLKTRTHLEISPDFENRPYTEYATGEDERYIELTNEVDLDQSINSPPSDFGSLTDEQSIFNDSILLTKQTVQGYNLTDMSNEIGDHCILCNLEKNVITNEDIQQQPFIQIFKNNLQKRYKNS